MIHRKLADFSPFKSRLPKLINVAEYRNINPRKNLLDVKQGGDVTQAIVGNITQKASACPEAHRLTQEICDADIYDPEIANTD